MNATLDFEAMSTVLLDISTNLKCLNCDHLLSFFPIYISQDKRNICGRCYHTLETEKDKYIHNEAYETIAQFVHFPCRYKKEGCHEKLRPADIANHEELCPFRTTKCPTVEFTDCDWEGALPNTLPHCYDKHHDIMLKNGEFDMNLAEGHNCNNLFVYNSVLFIITRKFYAINKLLEMSICNLGCEDGSKTIPCEIHFKSKNRSLVVSCSATPLTERQVTEIFLDSLKHGDKDLPIIHCTITLDKGQEQNDVVVTQETVNHELLSLLKCSSCLHYALPPIYQIMSSSSSSTVQNEIKCYECKHNGRERIKLGFNPDHTNQPNKCAIRNETLDNLGYILNYPCKFEKNGCSFVAKFETMKIHREFCRFGQYSCPLAEYVDCRWFGFGQEITSHIENAHENMFKVMSSEICEPIDSNSPGSSGSFYNSDNSKQPVVKCYVIKFTDKLFQVNFCQKQQYFHWSVHVIGQVDKQFMYELEIINPSNRNKRLIIKQPCLFWRKKKNDLFKTLSDHYSCVVKNQIESFMHLAHTITFKITIFK